MTLQKSFEKVDVYWKSPEMRKKTRHFAIRTFDIQSQIFDDRRLFLLTSEVKYSVDASLTSKFDVKNQILTQDVKLYFNFDFLGSVLDLQRHGPCLLLKTFLNDFDRRICIVNVTGETPVLLKIFAGVMLGNSLLYAEANLIFPTFLMLRKSLLYAFSTRVSPVVFKVYSFKFEVII